ncbi:hypothetical protein KUL72_31595 [Bradyrhizobium arachidis]|uniref:hypothetical protein n=1 Tax=Bradyrhizobium arachidis TaxID=858423 RepID=UPI002162DC21|nr:hypothetical protein [Bradyrhizobium arachidis]UVO40724.1 hypothetical protein KUL72_31595 [Bradyrhizobium arachidis]
MEAQTEKLFAPITTALKDALGTDALFELYLPVNSLNGRKAAQLSAIQQAIIDWVKTTAPTIPKRPYPDYKGNGVGLSRRPNVPFDVALCRFEPPIIPGKHFQIRHTVDDVEKLRRDRMKAAIDRQEISEACRVESERGGQIDSRAGAERHPAYQSLHCS